MTPQVREALKYFWKYAFCTDRPASRFEFLTVFTWYISPVPRYFSIRVSFTTTLLNPTQYHAPYHQIIYYKRR